LEKVSDLGNFITSQNVCEAINSGAEILDIGSGDCGWKERWHAEKTSQYLFKRK
jgi:hypothetical protein